MNLKPAIDGLNLLIGTLTDARDALISIGGGLPANIAKPRQKKKPTMSAAGRKRIAAAQRKRWAAQKAKQREAGKK
jgi:hypothetical protein